jgi:hypothetical protein
MRRFTLCNGRAVGCVCHEGSGESSSATESEEMEVRGRKVQNDSEKKVAAEETP